MAINAGDTTYYQAKRGIVQDGLVLNLDAAVDQSYPGNGTIWYDLEGSNSGTLTNGPTFDRGEGGGIVFDGTDDHVAGGDTSDVDDHYSLAIWWIATGPPSNNDSSGAMLFCQSPNLQHGIIATHSWANQRVLASHVINNAHSSNDSTALNNTINYLTNTYDGSDQKIYLNGQFSTSRSHSLDPDGSKSSYRIGKWGYSSYHRCLQGKIYSVALYNRALTAAEVLQNYNATKGRFE